MHACRYFNGTTWHKEYDLPLGAPIGPAVRGEGEQNMTWSRQFERASVNLDVLHKTADIAWASLSSSAAAV